MSWYDYQCSGPIERWCWWKVDGWLTSDMGSNNISLISNQPALLSVAWAENWRHGSDVKNVCVYVYLRFPQPVSPLSLIRPLSGLSDNNITIGHFCAGTGGPARYPTQSQTPGRNSAQQNINIHIQYSSRAFHLAGINVITGLIQILIVLIPQISEIFQNKQHTGDAAA